MSMAIKYQMAKKQRMAKGGMTCERCMGAGCEMCHGGRAMAEGGEVEDDGDMIDRIMRKRKGEPVADFEENDFDETDQNEPGDEADYTGENSGDEDGNKAEDEDERDVVARIMRSRSKKDRNPRPA